MYLCTYLITGGGWLFFLLRCAICIFVPNVIVIIVFRRTEEFKYAFDMIKEMLSGFIERHKKA